jgi:hypothetical protein
MGFNSGFKGLNQFSELWKDEPFHGLDEQNILDRKIKRTKFKVTKIIALIYDKR